MRETALAQGRQSQANRLEPVADEMRGLVTGVHETRSSVQPSSGIMGQSDFRALLDAVQARGTAKGSETSPADMAMERNRLVVAMSSAEMSDLEIARQLGITREEVRMVLNLQMQNKPNREVSL